jgi:cysteine desulfurase
MSEPTKRKVYFDHMANTPADTRVIKEMITCLETTFGNPLNIHDYGLKTAEVIEQARKKIADLIGADPSEIIFTSCGSESNNFAIKGLAKANEKKGKHIITSSIEHFSVLYPLKELEKEGFKVTYLPVDKYGLIDPGNVAKAITAETILVTITHASNEIGTIEPVAAIGALVKDKGILFHVDAVQTAGTIPVSVKELKADAMTLAANQFYGPTGIAALYLKKGTRILPFILGGTQEEGKRAGTQNISGIAGMGKAAELTKNDMEARNMRLTKLRDKLLAELPKKITDLLVTGHSTQRLPGHASVRVKFIEGESMSMFLNMDGIAVSTGSACVSKALKASHVLLAMGIGQEDVHGSLVFSMGKDNSEEDVNYVIEKLPPIVERLRAMSPMSNKRS